MTQHISALTWDHPRGYNALAAAAAALDPVRDGLAIEWTKQPLEGFESHPIEELCDRYDLVVLDHPHVGEAVEADCLQPLEKIFGVDIIDDLETATIGPCLSSYRYANRHWALPLDAASQVMARRSDLVDQPLPGTWDEVTALSETTGKVALSLAGPHALLTYFSIATALGEPPAVNDPGVLVSSATGAAVVELMRYLIARSPRSVRELNPIDLLDHMTCADDVALCPLVYGYVNYTSPTRGHPLRFSDAPRGPYGGRPGSTLGGTGIGISRRCPVTPELKRHLLWLLDEEAQTTFIPFHDGQPSRRSAWSDPEINGACGSFYSDTAKTLEVAYVRPRHAGYVAFQTEASAYLRQALEEGDPASDIVGTIQDMYGAGRNGQGAER